MSHIGTTLAMVSILVVAVPLFGQEAAKSGMTADAVQVELAAATHQHKEGYTRGHGDHTRLDPRIRMETTLRPEHAWGPERDHAAALAAAVGARVGRYEDAIHCQQAENFRWSTCKMPDVQLVLAFGPAQIDGDHATITTFGWERSARTGVVRSSIVYDLRREQGRWKVIHAFSRIEH